MIISIMLIFISIIHIISISMTRFIDTIAYYHIHIGIGSWCCVVEPMLTELVKTTTKTKLLLLYLYR